MINTSARPWYISILPPDALKRPRSGSSVLMCANGRCSSRPLSNAAPSWPYVRASQPLAPLPVGFWNDGVASVGFWFSSATMSVAIVNGAGTPAAVEPPSPPKFVPRVSPYQRWLLSSVWAQLLSTAGEGTEPLRVWPYQSLFIACACVALTQSALLLTPPLAVHNTLTSCVGS